MTDLCRCPQLTCDGALEFDVVLDEDADLLGVVGEQDLALLEDPHGRPQVHRDGDGLRGRRLQQRQRAERLQRGPACDRGSAASEAPRRPVAAGYWCW